MEQQQGGDGGFTGKTGERSIIAYLPWFAIAAAAVIGAWYFMDRRSPFVIEVTPDVEQTIQDTRPSLSDDEEAHLSLLE